MFVGFRVCHLNRWEHYHGFGFVLTTIDKETIVSAVEKRSPAELAGVRKGDIVYEINGINIRGKSHNEVNCAEYIEAEKLEIVVTQNWESYFLKQMQIIPSSRSPYAFHINCPTQPPATNARRVKTNQPSEAEMSLLRTDWNTYQSLFYRLINKVTYSME
ncbi:PDZ domain-containing protein [Pseudomonas syringae pv. actinidiae]|nr:PDZ domain-containing protein [Pseudomonas syringae pv. actinidiae]